MSNPDSFFAESVSTTNASIFIAIYILILIYCCFGLAVVCDVYFVPALQKLSYTYDLPPDIAGSTLMALGASVPELFASLIGVFVTEDDIGTGSIIGSSCFNLIAVPAACAFVASSSFATKLTVSPVPVMRNSAFYSITILVLLLIIKDNTVDVPESIILLLFFVMYMAFMIFCAQTKVHRDENGDSGTSSLEQSYISSDSAIGECNRNNRYKQVAKLNGCLGYQFVNQDGTQKHNQQQQNDNYILSPSQLIAHDQLHYHGSNNNQQIYSEKTPLVGIKNNSTSKSYDNIRYTTTTTINNNNNQQRDLDWSSVQQKVYLFDNVSIDMGIAVKNSACLMKQQNDDLQSFEQHADSWLNSKWVLIPMLPITLCLKILTPLKFKNTCWTIWTFLVSIALIGALTYISVSMVHLFGKAVGMPETVAGMTILSWGTGIPELIASIVLIKKTAQADMAICNTIGSNVIDASFCLSLPWLVKCLLNRAEGLKPEVAIQSGALPWTCLTLLVSVVLLILILKLHNWELNFSVGVWLMLTYVAFVCVATYLESQFSDDGFDLFAII